MFGAGGGIGGALTSQLRDNQRFDRVVDLSRSSEPAIDFLTEASLREAAVFVAAQSEVRLVVVATGFLHDEAHSPEKSWRELDYAHMARSFALNAIRPALIMKHLLPLLPRQRKSVFATLSARVGSIGDNRAGGWYTDRASKAALNRLVRTEAVKLARRSTYGLCIALHPGTVATSLSAPFVANGLEAHPSLSAARHLLAVVDQLTAEASGGFFDWPRQPVPG